MTLSSITLNDAGTHQQKNDHSENPETSQIKKKQIMTILPLEKKCAGKCA